MIIDSKLKFSFHNDVLAGKLSRVVGVIRKVTCLINSHHMRTLYFSLFYSILIYDIASFSIIDKLYSFLETFVYEINGKVIT